METVLEALNNGRSMIRNYFNVELSAGIGEPVDDPLKISISYQEPDRPLISALLTPHLYLLPRLPLLP